jgi:Holliday junction resolvase RusA-like endonuclease
MKFTIPLPPITKKNSQQIITCKGRPMIIPSKQYKEYEKNCKIFLPHGDPIDKPVNVKALYYMPTRRRVDLTNLESALMDVLVHHGVLADDNSNIVVSTDGSRVLYDKENPRTEVEITWQT